MIKQKITDKTDFILLLGKDSDIQEILYYLLNKDQSNNVNIQMKML